MTQLNFTLEKDFFIGLFAKGREEAFGDLMECMLNQFLLAESAEKLGAAEYERSDERSDYRNGTRERSLVTRIGTITLAVPRHRNEPFHTTLIENYQRNEQALIATMMEMVVQGVATRKVEKVTEELCGTRFSKSTVSELCKGLDSAVREFRYRKLETNYPFVMADAMYIKVREDYRVRSKALLIAMGINTDGRKEILGFDLCENETELGWGDFFAGLKQRGLQGVDLVISDSHAGLVRAIRSHFPNVAWQRCQFHFTRNILDKTPKRYQQGLAAELREMFNTTSFDAAKKLRDEIIEEYRGIADSAMDVLDDGFMDAMNVMCMPYKYRQTLRTSNLLERENQELRKREKVIKVFPNAESAIRLMGAVLLDHHKDWATRSRVFSMGEYFENRDSLLFKLRGAA